MEWVGDLEGVVEVQRRERTLAEQAEAEGRERDDHRADRADPLQSLEGGFHRDVRRRLVLDELAHDVQLLVLPARWLLHEERGDRRD